MNVYSYPYRPYMPVGYIRPDQTPPIASPIASQMLPLILQAIFNQREAQLFYSILHERAITPFQKRQIAHAYNDEIKHEQMLTGLYRQLTGQTPQVPTPGPVEVSDFQEGIKRAFEDELEAAELYRGLYLMTTDLKLRDLFFELMTDEMEHAQRFAYIRIEI